MKCPYCNQENVGDAKFCEYCGKPLKEEEISSMNMNRVTIHEENPGKNSSYKNIIIAVLVAIIIVLIGLFLYVGNSNGSESKIANNNNTVQEEKTNVDTNIDTESEVANNISAEEDQHTTKKEEIIDKKEEIVEKKEEKPEEPVEKVEEYKVYRLNYEMLYRKEPNYKAKKLGYVKANKTVKIYETVESEKGSIWGKLENGAWMCIRDNRYTYLTEE